MYYHFIFSSSFIVVVFDVVDVPSCGFCSYFHLLDDVQTNSNKQN